MWRITTIEHYASCRRNKAVGFNLHDLPKTEVINLINFSIVVFKKVGSMKKVLLNFIQFSVIEKVSYYRNLVAKTTGNPLLPTPEISMAELTAALDQFEAAIVSARDGSHIAISALHDCETATDKKFRILAHYVDKIADGDETTILSAGFQASKDPAPRNKPPLSAYNGSHSGSVILDTKAIDKAGSYIIQIADGSGPFVETDWRIVAVVTQSRYEVTGLIKGKVYSFRVAAVTPSGTTDFCAPVEKLVT